MKKYQQFVAWNYALTTIVVSVSIAYGKEWLNEQIPKNNILIVFLVIIFAAILFKLVTSMTNTFFKNSQLLRRLILGKDYIEGFWSDVVFDEQKKVIGGGIVHIYLENGDILIEGTSYKKNDEGLSATASFHSTMTSYENSKLDFTYLYRDTERHFHSPRYALYEFVRVGSNIPLGYAGFFFGSNDNVKFHVEAQRITDKQTIRRLKDPKERILVVKELLIEVENGLVLED